MYERREDLTMLWLSFSVGVMCLMGIIPTAGAAKPGDDEIPETYYGKGGVPVRIRMSTEKIGVRFKKNVAKSNLNGIIKRQAEAEEMDSVQLEAVDRHRNRAAMIRVKPGKAKREVHNMLHKLRKMPEVEDARPVYEVAPDAKDHEGTVVGYFSAIDDEVNDIPAGSLVVRGRAFQGADPDPQMFKTELLVWDNFEDQELTVPTVYSEKYYASAPPWDLVSGANDWIIVNDSPNPQHYVLKSAGSYVETTHESDRIRIEQEQPDLDVSFSFKFDDFSGTPPTSGFGNAQILFRKSDNDSVFVRLYRRDDDAGGDPHVFTRLDLRCYDPDEDDKSRTLLNKNIYPDGILLSTICYPAPSGNCARVDPLDPSSMVYYLGPLVPNTWYEMHIQAQGAVVRVFMRERDAQEKAKRAWATVIPNPPDPEDPNAGCYFPDSVI
ncbi:MAG TPA: hypothetical protein PKO36_04585 [Candidatus Hydrogenedentes bacterium]|nr:hypothetical protein [Candidatus Hydrogenedentota bacterium]